MPKKSKMTAELAAQILAAELRDGNDAGVETVREYFVAMMKAIWLEGEGFSGKRPFGNSGWEHDIQWALVNAKLVRGALDENGYVEDCDSVEADKLITEALDFL